MSDDLKQRFLNKYHKDTKHYMKNILFADAVRVMEKNKEKDLYKFSREEIIQLIGELSPYSLQAAITQKSVIKKYIDFTLAEGYLHTGINFAKTIKPKDLEKIVSNRMIELKYVTRNEILDIVNSLNNDIDKAFLLLLFEGVKGKQMIEITSLKKGDVDYENKILKLSNRSKPKKISQELVNALYDASKQKEYLVVIDTSKKKTSFYRELPNTDYIIRSMGLNPNKPVKYRTLLARLRTIKTEIGNPYLTSTSILQSGMIAYAKKIKEERDLKNLETEHYVEITEWAGKAKSNWFETKRVVSKFV